MLGIFNKENKLLKGYLLTNENWDKKDTDFELFRQAFEQLYKRKLNYFKNKGLGDGMPFIAIYFICSELGINYMSVIKKDSYNSLTYKIIKKIEEMTDA